MMKRNYILLGILMLFASCGDFLDVNPDAEVINKDMFNNKQGCEDAINGIYAKLNTNMYDEAYFWSYFELLSQDLGCSSMVTPNYYFTTYEYEQLKDVLKVMWSKPYELIGYVNNAISQIENQGNETYTNSSVYLGELYGLRGLLHFELLKCFAPHIELSPNAQGIPYVTSYSFKHTAFSSVSEVYDKIITDFKTAQKYLEADKDNLIWPRVDENSIKDNFMKYRQIHMNYYAVTGFLARVLRMKGDYDDARTEALKVIDSNHFPLASKDEIINLVAGTLSPKETIFGVYSTSYAAIAKLRLYDGASWTSLSPFYTAQGGQFLFNYESTYGQDLGDNSGSDARLQWIRSTDGTSSFLHLLKCVDVTVINASYLTPESRGLIAGISLLRIPEMYYIVAEAYLRVEKNSDLAAKYLDPVLLSRGLTKLESRLPAISADLDLLYNERHKELYGEGQRWFDMKKRNEDIRSNQALSVKPASDKLYVFPIPVEEYSYNETVKR